VGIGSAGLLGGVFAVILYGWDKNRGFLKQFLKK